MIKNKIFRNQKKKKKLKNRLPSMTLIKKYKERKLTTADIKWLNYSIICVLILIAITSIVWSTSMHIICGDFNYGIFDAKIEFRLRNFDQLTSRSQEIYQKDLSKILNTRKLYSSKTELNFETKLKENGNKEIFESNKSGNNASVEPKKITHLFQISPNDKKITDFQVTEFEHRRNTSKAAKSDLDLDRIFLSSTVVEMHHWGLTESPVVQFIYNFPYITEIVAIIWTAMCLIFQSGANKYWGLPRPWQIVVPSILVFLIMSVATLIYTIIASIYIMALCTELKRNLIKPDAISCGMAISVLRPKIRFHELSHDAYFNLFQISYIVALLLWILVLVVMMLRFMFALDFQLIDVKSILRNQSQHIVRGYYNHRFFETSSNPSQQHKQQNHSELTELNRSEEDFHSALSRLSEPIVPLLEEKSSEIV